MNVKDGQVSPPVDVQGLSRPMGVQGIPGAEEQKVSGADAGGDNANDKNPVRNPYAVTDEMRRNATQGVDRKVSVLREYLDNLPHMETKEERERRERKERSKKIIAAVGDGLSAMTNLFFTSKGAPNMYNHEKGSALDALGSNLDKLKAEREKNADRYLNFALRLGDAEGERDKTLRDLEAQQERRKLAKEKAEREEEAHGWEAALQPDRQREQTGKADTAENKALTAKAEADFAPALQEAKVETEKAKKGFYEASAGASKASAANSYASARKSAGGNKFYVESKDGVVRGITEDQIDKEFSKIPEAMRKVAGNISGYGENKRTYKPTKEQKMQAIAEYEMTQERKKSNGDSASGGFDRGRYKRGGKTPPPLN